MKNIDRNLLVEKWLKGGQSQKQFSTEHNIKHSTFLYWVKRYRIEKQADPGFARVELAGPSEPNQKARIEITLADDLVIRIY